MVQEADARVAAERQMAEDAELQLKVVSMQR